ncbi:MAG: hypothetical protein JSV36_01645, partial [Anaerolineae bacterium]
PPFKVAEFDIMYEQGISREGEVLDLGVEYGVIEKRGSFYSYGEERLAQGRENAKQYLRENPEVTFEIENHVLQAVGLPPRLVLSTPPSEEADDASANGDED